VSDRLYVKIELFKVSLLVLTVKRLGCRQGVFL
jgi:hypothetical protein